MARVEAKPGKENDVLEFLKSALPLAEAEPDTVRWYALKLGPSTFGIFDTFTTDAGRQAHLAGEIPIKAYQKKVILGTRSALVHTFW